MNTYSTCIHGIASHNHDCPICAKDIEFDNLKAELTVEREKVAELERDLCQIDPERITEQRDEAVAALAIEREKREAAEREALRLANSIWRSEYQKEAPDWRPSDSVAGIISQIDNMYAGIRAQRDQWSADYKVALNELVECQTELLASQNDVKRLRDFLSEAYATAQISDEISESCNDLLFNTPTSTEQIDKVREFISISLTNMSGISMILRNEILVIDTTDNLKEALAILEGGK